jgi:hypothetical protein
MKKVFLILLIATSFYGCKKESCLDDCQVENPARDLPWLKKIIDLHTADPNSTYTEAAYPKAEIVSYTYQGQTVFLLDLCVQCPDSQSWVANCQGEAICEFGGITGKNTCPDFSQKAVEKEVIWKNY